MNQANGWTEVARTFRGFLDQAHALLRREDGEIDLRKALTSPQPFSALVFLTVQSPQFRSRFVYEVLVAVMRGPQSSLLLARDVLRGMPRNVLEDRVPKLLDDLLARADDQDYARLAEVTIEMRLANALRALRTGAEGHSNEEVRQLRQDLDAVEEDPARWGRLVSEWPIEDDQ